MTQPDGSTPPVTGGDNGTTVPFPDGTTPPIPVGIDLPGAGSGGGAAEVTKWDVDVLESFAAEMDRHAGVLNGLASTAPDVVSKITGGVPAERATPVHLPTIQGVGNALEVICDKVTKLAGSLTRDAAAIRAFAKDAAETDDINAASLNNVDGQV